MVQLISFVEIELTPQLRLTEKEPELEVSCDGAGVEQLFGTGQE